MKFIGVDPGKKGAIALIPTEISWEVKTLPTPYIDGYGLDVDKILKFLEYYVHDPILGKLPTTACIEKQWSRPKQDIKSMDVLIGNFWEWVGVLKTLQVEIQIVAPQTWKAKVLHNANATKADAIEFANTKYGLSLQKKDDGIADACAIAFYAKMVYNIQA